MHLLGHSTKPARKKKAAPKKKAGKNATVARVPGTRKSLAKSHLAKKNPVLKAWSDAAKRSYSDYKAGHIAGVPSGLGFRQLVSNSHYKAHVRSIAEK